MEKNTLKKLLAGVTVLGVLGATANYGVSEWNKRRIEKANTEFKESWESIGKGVQRYGDMLEDSYDNRNDYTKEK